MMISIDRNMLWDAYNIKNIKYFNVGYIQNCTLRQVEKAEMGGTYHTNGGEKERV
jgi:hypothetical protein